MIRHNCRSTARLIIDNVEGEIGIVNASAREQTTSTSLKGIGLRSHERNCRQHCQTLKRKPLMKKILITLVCALVASPAFAQTKSKSTEVEGVTVIGIAVKTAEGTVADPSNTGSATRAGPSNTVVVSTLGTRLSGRYVLEGPGRIRDRSGREIPATAVKLGTPVRVVYTQVGGTLTVDYIVVEG
jgi:hypothetical protein